MGSASSIFDFNIRFAADSDRICHFHLPLYFSQSADVTKNQVDEAVVLVGTWDVEAVAGVVRQIPSLSISASPTGNFTIEISINAVESSKRALVDRVRFHGQVKRSSTMELARLMGQVVVAAEGFAKELRARHAAYLLASESPQGGFPNRAGHPDPYYTAFGLAGLALLGQLNQPLLHRAIEAVFPRRPPGNLPPPSSNSPLWQRWTLAELVGLVACASFAQGKTPHFASQAEDPFGRWGGSVQQVVQDYLSLLRRPDGGYAKHPASSTSSTYGTFLATLLQQWVGLPIETVENTAQMLLDRQRDDGGFAEWPSARQSGVNPTAAAVGWWALTGRMPPSVRNRAAAFLASMQSAEGGFRAHGRIPIADLLSTFTALVALELLEASSAVNRQAVRRYILSLQLPTGGFRAGLWDQAADVEYTFYGLASLALLADTAPAG